MADVTAAKPGSSFELGLHFQLEAGWHVYWRNPGDSGEPPRAKWSLPPGLSIGDIQWPVPKSISISSLVDYGYEREVTLVVPARLAAGHGQPLTISAALDLLTCKDVCLPAKARVALTVPVQSGGGAAQPGIQQLFESARSAMPLPMPKTWSATVAEGKDDLVLTFHCGRSVGNAFFFPIQESVIDDSAPRRIVPSADGFHMTLRKSDQFSGTIHQLSGVLEFGGRGYLIDAPVTR